MADKVVVMKDWLDQCEALPMEFRKDFYYYILRYGIYGETPETGNPLLDMSINQITVQMNKMNGSYNEIMEQANKGGRKKAYDDVKVYELAMQGYTGGQVGDMLGIPAKTIYGSAGWKKAKEEKNNLKILSEIENNSEKKFEF